MKTPAPAQPEHELPRVLHLYDAVAVVVGSIIGSGIFLKVDKVATEVGLDHGFGPVLLIWLVGGIVTLCGSLALGELAAMMPHAGGPYVYLRTAYGRTTGYLWGWSEFAIVRTGSLGSLAFGTVIYFDRLLVSLKELGYLPGFLESFVPLSLLAQTALALAAIWFLSYINVIGTRASANTQNLTTVLKVGFLALLMFGPWLFLPSGSSQNLHPLWKMGEGWGFWKGVGLAMLAVYWPYDGWINIGPVAEEIKEPQRNVPRALLLGVLTVTFVYVLTVVGYHLTLPMEKVAQAKSIAAEVFQQILGAWGPVLAATGVMISTFGALNSNLLVGPRIYFAMAREGLAPSLFRKVHPLYKTPANAVILQAVWSTLQVVVVAALYSQPKDVFDTLTDFVVVGGTTFYSLAVAAVYVLRWTHPNDDRPYRTWGYPITPALYLAASAMVIISSALADLNGLLVVAGLLVLGLLLLPLLRSGPAAK